MEKINISKIKEKNDSLQTKKILKIYQEVHLNKLKCPRSIFNTVFLEIIHCQSRMKYDPFVNGGLF